MDYRKNLRRFPVRKSRGEDGAGGETQPRRRGEGRGRRVSLSFLVGSKLAASPRAGRLGSCVGRCLQMKYSARPSGKRKKKLVVAGGFMPKGEMQDGGRGPKETPREKDRLRPWAPPRL